MTTARKPELLAPAGKEEVYYAVVEAGADAVYLAGKQFNMRRHRKDFNFDDDALRRVCAHARGAGKRIYVTVNSLVAPEELDELRDYLQRLAEMGPAALIVQDFAVVDLCRELSVPLELHASTMMNVGTAEAAKFLRQYGFTRAVTSRDITLDDVRRIREASGMEVEYFIHGDMCSVQSGQCLTSGVVFGKSSNRGQCLKPCRWAYDLVSERTGQVLAHDRRLLAAKDMCLLQQIPELVNAGVDALKIEGRMKPADVLAPVVALYRAAIDRYCGNPLQPAKVRPEAARVHENRVRNLTTGFAFRTPGDDYFDPTGEREVVMLSTGGTLAAAQPVASPFAAATSRTGAGHIPEVTCVAGTAEGARAALEAGAANVVLAWEGDLRSESSWSLDDIRDLALAAAARGRRLLLNSPKVATERDVREWQQVTAAVGDGLACCLSHFAFLDGPLGGRDIWLDHATNIVNPVAARFFSRLGVRRIMPGLECSQANVLSLAESDGVAPLDILVHGPVTGMILEHCLPAMATQRISKRDFCQMPCAEDAFALVDSRGNRRALRCDRYCRNHILLEREVGLLPVLDAFRHPRIAGWRVDARVYTPAKTAALVSLYLDAARGGGGACPAREESFYRLCPADSLTWGAYARGIAGDAEVPLARIKREEHDESQRAKAG